MTLEHTYGFVGFRKIEKYNIGKTFVYNKLHMFFVNIEHIQMKKLNREIRAADKLLCKYLFILSAKISHGNTKK